MVKPEIRAVLFDLGGVILRTDDPQPRIDLAQSLGRTYAELDAIVFNNSTAQLAEVGQASPEQVWGEIGQILGIEDEQIRSTRRRFFAGDTVDADLVSLIAHLHGRLRTGLLSNTWVKDLKQFIADDLHIADIFDVILSSAALGRAKPDAEIFFSALQALGTQAQETVFVDDNAANILAASRLGIQTVRFLNSAQTRHELLELIQAPGMETGFKPVFDV
jgi:glucose-1-phosphatase